MPKKSVRRAKSQPYHHGDLRRALIDTALELVTEEQDWTFSLREVARRAGVSHHAPYNHFPEKQDLLGAVAVVGFERLRDGMLRATAGLPLRKRSSKQSAALTCVLDSKTPLSIG